MEELEVLNLDAVVGKDIIEFREAEYGSDLINCLNPIPLDKLGLIVPCGHCSLCLKKRKAHWAMRSFLESSENVKLGKNNYFITLTFSEQNKPYRLEKKPLQDFLKRFRNKFDERIKYIACGELGSHTFRPHYHLVVFGSFDDYLTFEKKVLDSWTLGFVQVSVSNFERCSYVSGYVMKKIQSCFASDVELEKEEYYKGSVSFHSFSSGEFFAMSRRPGIGYSYVENHKEELFKNMYVSINGCKYSLPRYFRTKLEDLMPGFKYKYMAYCLREQEELFRKSGLTFEDYKKNFYSSVRQKDTNIKAKLNLFKGGVL